MTNRNEMLAALVSGAKWDVAVAIKRGNPLPLDESAVYGSYAEALAYVQKADTTAYPGQILSVVNEDGTNKYYGVTQQGGLEELGAATLGDEASITLIDGGILSLKNFGKKYYACKKDENGEIITPVQYELVDGFMDGLEPKVRKYTATNDAGEPYDAYELAWYQPNPTTVEGLASDLASMGTRVDAAASAAEAAALAAEGKIASVIGSGSISVETDDNRNATTSLKLDNSGNVKFSETDTGLKAEVEIPAQVDYSVSVTETTPEGYAKTYVFQQNNKTLTTINIPRDMVVSSGQVVTNPEGQAGGTYIELTLSNATSDKLYINVSDLIEYVTSGSAADDDIVVAVSDDYKVTATLSDAVKASLAKADSAVQKIESGTENGTINVDGTDVAVKGLGSAAFVSSDAFDASGSASQALASAKEYVDAALTWSSLDS